MALLASVVLVAASACKVPIPLTDLGGRMCSIYVFEEPPITERVTVIIPGVAAWGCPVGM